MDIPDQKYYLRVRSRLYPAHQRERRAGRVHDQPAIHLHEKRICLHAHGKTHRGEKDSRRGHGHPGNIIHHHERRGRNDVFQTIYLPGQLHVPTHDRRENGRLERTRKPERQVFQLGQI